MRQFSHAEIDPLRQVKQEWVFKSRTVLGQIEAVDEANGTCDVIVFGTREKYKCTIPTGAISAQGFSSAWMRFMPQPLDYVKCSYRSDNYLEILSMALWGEEYDNIDPETQAGALQPFIGGYATLRKENAAKNREVITEFDRLYGGEWDFRSSGGAYIKGYRSGRLLFRAGGLTTMYLDKAADEKRSSVGLAVEETRGSETRLGDIKRVFGTNLEERATGSEFGLLSAGVTPANVALTLNPAGVNKEWRVRVGASLPDPSGGAFPITPTLYEAHAGHLVDVNIATRQPQAARHTNTLLPLRYRAICRNNTPVVPLETLSVEVDELGNVRVKQSNLAVNPIAAGPSFDVEGAAVGSNLRVNFAQVGITASVTTLNLTATTEANLTGANVNLIGSATVRLGSAAASIPNARQGDSVATSVTVIIPPGIVLVPATTPSGFAPNALPITLSGTGSGTVTTGSGKVLSE